MNDADDILFNKEQLREEALVNYLNGNLPAEEAHKVEEQMAASPFVNDAVEGLQEFSNRHKLSEYVRELNKNLKRQTNKKKQKMEKRKIKDLKWVVLSVVIILLLCFIAYYIINMQKPKKAVRRNAFGISASLPGREASGDLLFPGCMGKT